jgi:RecB family exonuclease
MSLYRECPAKYKFRYIDRVPQKPKHFFSFGTSMHEALEFFYTTPEDSPMSLSDLIQYYKTHWLSEGYESPSQESEYYTKGEGILADFYNKHITNFKLPFFTEYRFDLVVNGVPVTGYIDRIDKVDNKIAVLDYKTGKALAKGRLDTDDQLTMYQMACEELLGLKVESLTFYHLNSGTAFTTSPRSEETIQVLKDQIVSVATLISQGVFTPMPEERKCGWCDYKFQCPAYQDQFISLKN